MCLCIPLLTRQYSNPKLWGIGTVKTEANRAILVTGNIMRSVTTGIVIMGLVTYFSFSLLFIADFVLLFLTFVPLRLVSTVVFQSTDTHKVIWFHCFYFKLNQWTGCPNSCLKFLWEIRTWTTRSASDCLECSGRQQSAWVCTRSYIFGWNDTCCEILYLLQLYWG